MTSLWCLYCQLRTYFIVSVLMLCCLDIVFYGLVFNASRFSWLCSHTRFITKQKETDVKSAYLNRGSGEVVGLPGFHTFSGSDIMGSYLSNKKIKMLVIFQKGKKVTNKAFAALVATVKLTNKAIARIENAFVYFTSHQQKLRRFQGCYYCLLRQNKKILRILIYQKNHLFSRYCNALCQCIMRNKDLETKVYLSNQEGHGRKLQTGHTFQQNIMKLVKCNWLYKIRRTGKCICKNAKLYCTTFFAFSLDNDVFCRNQGINDKPIVDISHVED